MEYTLKIKKIDRLDISYVTEDKNAKVVIEGNNNLANGSQVKVIVTAEDGISREYIINIEKSNSLILPIVILSLVLVGIIALIIIKKKKKI